MRCLFAFLWIKLSFPMLEDGRERIASKCSACINLGSKSHKKRTFENPVWSFLLHCSKCSYYSLYPLNSRAGGWWVAGGGSPPRNGNTMRLNLCKLAENLLLNIERECANNCGRGNYIMEAASCTLHSYYWKRTIPCFQIHTSATRAQRLNKKVPSFSGDNQIQKNVKRIFPELFDR